MIAGGYRYGTIGCLRRTLADHDVGRDEGLAPAARARPRRAQHSSGAQAGRQLVAQCAPALHEQRLVDRLMADAHGLIVRKVDRQAAGDLLRAPGVAHRRSCRGPCRRPFQATVGPGTAAPPGATTAPVSRSSTWVRNAAFSASFVGLGRRAARSACHCAVVARYSKPPLRVAALRRNSREIVEAARPSRRATSCMEQLCARRSAISSRSANERYRPESGFADGLDIDGGIPPACLNHRVPTACDTPAAIAASSLAIPAAIAIQNRRRSSRPVAGGRPGENGGARPDRSDRRFRPGIATSFQRVLRRPLESAYVSAVTSVPLYSRSGTAMVET